MIPEKDLLTVTGKANWMSGIYKRARWAVASMYAALADHQRDLRNGREQERRELRRDRRAKDHLVPLKRFEAAHAWLVALLQKTAPTTKCPLWLLPETLMIITDASPQGCGGILLSRTNKHMPWVILQAFEYPVTENDAKMFKFELGSHKSQAFLEALALWIALDHWKEALKGLSIGLSLRSDSTVALSVTDKFSSKSPMTNYLAGELALKLEALKIDSVVLSHVPGKMNVLADFLSRPLSRGETPRELARHQGASAEPVRARAFSPALA